MRARILVLTLAVAITVLLIPGLAACSPDAAPAPADTAVPEEQVGVEESFGEDATIIAEEPDEPPAALTEDETEYLLQIDLITGELTDAFYSLDDLLIDPEVEDDEWLSEIALLVTDILTLCDEAEQVEPPESMTEVHIAFLETLLNFSDATDVLLEGIDSGDTGLIEQASGEMWLASEILAEFMDNVEEG